MCGVSKRQLQYWTDRGLIQESGSSPAKRSYRWSGIEKVCLIKQGKDAGLSLEAEEAKAGAFLGRSKTELLGRPGVGSECAAEFLCWLSD